MSIAKVTFGPSALPGYEVGDKALPAVIMLQEWWGITEIIKKQAELLASNGFRVLVPDLYKGKIGVTAEEAHHLFDSLDFHGAVKEIGEALEYLKSTGAPKVGITGFCMGGALTLASSSKLTGVAAAVPCYGIPPSSPGAFPEIFDIKIPVLGIFAEKDKQKGFSDVQTAHAFADKFKAQGGDLQLEVYPTGVHGFFNQLIKPEGVELVQREQGSLTSEEELQAAWSALVGHFNKHLKA